MDSRVAVVHVLGGESEIAGQAVVVPGTQGVTVQQHDRRLRAGPEYGGGLEEERRAGAEVEIDPTPRHRIFS